MAQKMNASEKDLEKFIRFWAMKSAQVIVQSRLGEKISTQGTPLSGSDWFNISIKDHPEVYAEMKKTLSMHSNETILKSFPLCIEISLKTAEGDQMVLEVWSLDLQQSNNAQEKAEKFGSNSSLNDQQILKASHTIYNRMGIMLKSLISLTRATPAYKLSRRQCPDSYRIYYRIYMDKPQIHTLGEGHKQVKFGHVNTMVGTLTMSVAYRTKMTITPTTAQQKANETNTIMLKSDHFRPSDLTKSQQQLNAAYKKNLAGNNFDKKVIDIDKPLRPGAFTDVTKLKQFTEEDYILPETPPFEWLIKRTRNESAGSGSVESLNRKNDSPSPSPLSNVYQNNININNNLNNGLKNFNNNNILVNNNITNLKNENDSSSSNKTQVLPTEPTATANGCGSCLSVSPPLASVKSLIIPTPPASRHGSAPSLQQASHVPDDDSLLKELHFPFASPASHVSDLAKFYRDCYHAPPLHCLSDISTTENVAGGSGSSSGGGGGAAGGCGVAALAANNADTNVVDELSRQLEQFETSLEDYDKLVTQLGLTGSSSTGSRSSGGLQMSN